MISLNAVLQSSLCLRDLFSIFVLASAFSHLAQTHQTWWDTVHPSHGMSINILNALFQGIPDAVLYTALVVVMIGVQCQLICGANRAIRSGLECAGVGRGHWFWRSGFYAYRGYFYLMVVVLLTCVRLKGTVAQRVMEV